MLLYEDAVGRALKRGRYKPYREVDAVVFGVGTGGTLTGAGRYLRERNPNLKIYAVEPEEASALSGLPIGPHGIQGIGAGFRPSILDMSLIDEIFRVHTDEAVMFARRLTYDEGLLVGVSSGANVCAAVRVACRPEMAGKVIVTVLPSGGDRRRLFNDAYVNGRHFILLNSNCINR